METDTIEWAEVAPGTVVVAAEDRAWLHQRGLGAGSEPFSMPMDGPGSLATTRYLLDGAVGAGQRSVSQTEPPPPLSATRWVFRLAGYYHTTRVTPGLMEKAAARFAASGSEALARWAETKAREERGHDELALRDLRALGYAAERVVDVLRPEIAVALADAFAAWVLGPDPVYCVGYAYALERLALTRGPDYLARVEGVLPKGVLATRCLRVHSGSGSDARHVEETAVMVAGLPAGDRAKIALACYETAALCSMSPKGGHLTEDALQQVLAPLKNTHNPGEPA
jgi:hypothetical protein